MCTTERGAGVRWTPLRSRSTDRGYSRDPAPNTQNGGKRNEKHHKEGTEPHRKEYGCDPQYLEDQVLDWEGDGIRVDTQDLEDYCANGDI